MYSKSYSARQRQYPGEVFSDSGDDLLRLPPRYGGVRFTKARRNDGRDEVFERSFVSMAREGGESNPVGDDALSESLTGGEEVTEDQKEILPSFAQHDERGGSSRPDIEAKEDGDDKSRELEAKGDISCDTSSKKSKLGDLFTDFGQDDILIVALIVLLASQGSENNRDIILLLALLLCFR